MTKKRIFIFALILSVIIFSGCASVKSGGVRDHIRQKWQLQFLQGYNDAEVLQTKGFIDFSAMKDKSAGAAFVGCNRIFFSYELSENRISVSNIGRTKRMCTAIALEDKFISLLKKVTAYQTKGRLLMLKDAQGNVLIKAGNLKW